MTDLYLKDAVENLFGLRTPFHLVPKDWLDIVEPKIIRRGSCWVWTGAVDSNGSPVTYITEDGVRKQISITRRVVDWLYPSWDRSWRVIHACGTKNCLRPKHFLLTDRGARDLDLKEIVKKSAVRITRWNEENE